MAGLVSQTATEPIRLRFNDQTPVVVTPEDEDRFMTTAAEAARACKEAEDLLKWNKEFQSFLGYINAWCRTRPTDVARAYMSFSNEGLDVFVLTKGSDYRFDLDDEIADLDLVLAKEFPRCPTEISHFPELPAESLTSFFDPQKALQLYGD